MCSSIGGVSISKGNVHIAGWSISAVGIVEEQPHPRVVFSSFKWTKNRSSLWEKLIQ